MARHTAKQQTGPAPAGPYSPSVRIGNLVAVSGQVGYLVGATPSDKTLVDGIAEQTRVTLSNVENALHAVGASMDDVLSTEVYLADLADFEAMNTVYATAFSHPYPARTTVSAGLKTGVLVEISVLAVTSDVPRP